jgi:hypothetical protein
MRKDVFWVLGILGAVFFLYARQLDVSPPALHRDEAATIRQAQAIAQTGRDVDGRRIPVITLGVQIVFSSFFLSVLGLGRK